eukprot:UN08677
MVRLYRNSGTMVYLFKILIQTFAFATMRTSFGAIYSIIFIAITKSRVRTWIVVICFTITK